jgi:hypothetical protein
MIPQHPLWLVQFESGELLSKMVLGGCVDLTSDFDIQVRDLNGKPAIPG